MIIGICLFLVALILGGLYFLKYSELNRINKDIKAIEKELSSESLNDKIKLVKSIKLKETENANRLEIIKAIRKEQEVWLKFLDELSARMPQDVWLAGMAKGNSPDPNKRDKVIDVEGYGLSAESVFNYFRNLRLCPYVVDLRQYTITIDLNPQGYIYKFKVSMETNLSLYPEFK